MIIAPVITIDGPSASGKGTVARQLASALNFHYLDSGKIYRAFTLYALAQEQDINNQPAMAACAKIFVDNEDFLPSYLQNKAIYNEATSQVTSTISAYATVRNHLKIVQIRARKLPGLVADGRDMGSHIFPDAVVKIYLTADSEVRAMRRYAQLKNKGGDESFPAVLTAIQNRDSNDSQRKNSPLQKMPDTILIDSTHIAPAEIVQNIIAYYHKKNR